MLLILAAALLPKQLPDSSPESLIQRIVRYETHGGGVGTPEFFSFFTPSVRRAIKRDSAGRDVGVLDYDPLCQCQDNDGLRLRVLRTSMRGAWASVDLERGSRADTSIRIRLTLRRIGNDWKVADVSTAKVPSLAAQLRAH